MARAEPDKKVTKLEKALAEQDKIVEKLAKVIEEEQSMAEETIKRSMRYRVNVSISTKGQKTWDCTCDGEGFSMEEVLAESDKLVKALDTRYPIKEG